LVRMQIENSRKLSHNNLVPKRTWTWMEYDLACMFHSHMKTVGLQDLVLILVNT
jgi:hypothetical protein